MSELIYGLCALTALMCTCLLWHAYFSRHNRLLFWGGLCFMGLTINNILVIIDEVLVPMDDLSIWRQASALVSMSILLYGLIWESN